MSIYSSDTNLIEHIASNCSYVLRKSINNSGVNIFSMKFTVSYTLVNVIAVCILATSGDITMSWTSPMYPKLYSNDTSINPLGRSITEDEDSWIGSLINVGAIVGPLPFGFIGERFGRKIGLLCIAIPHVVSYLTMAFAKEVYLFYFGRILGGIAVGGGYTLLPMYIAEVSDEMKRGFYSVFLGIFWGFGNFLPYLIGPFLSVMWFNVVLACFPVTFFIVFLMFGVETPHYLVGKGDTGKAEKVLMLLRSKSKEGVQKELMQIKEGCNKNEVGHFKDILLNPGQRKALFIALAFITFQQFSGMNAITFYLEPIFKASGSSLPSDISSLIAGAVIFITSFLTPALVSFYSRNAVSLVSIVGMALPLGMLGAFFYALDNNMNVENIMWMPLASLILVILTYQIGFSVLPWTISSELFSKDTKHIAASFVSITCWVGSFVVTKFFRDMTNLLGNAGTFLFFSGSCLLCAVFVVVYVPETRGKTLIEIQKMLQRKISMISVVSHN
ncbi:unnamed protein product [Acanthoscelides obtectus]|uniref:Major facilitator superfamily (MFS) profile domain-containing protein n=1 Tax=Acanthoscelides obtectus TaxID=200917 RepID=A0A9P0KEL6_ACAOB|nr:unnamed protein product [Acanthoscelides obtectus]CAK1648484.1 Facilitated trehalose transporter Tret1-2 homolog [Acanthoscelides obtectus]